MKRILVIDDDEGVRGLIVETLTLRGWEPLCATNGREGLEVARAERPDLVLCDIQMPLLDGYGVLKELRGNSATATTPFVFLTALSDKPGMRQAMELGADDYLVKPFTIKELIAAVEARFQKQDLLERSSDEKLEELRGNLSFALPHELVTPLNSILGFSSLILESAESPEIKEYAGLIRGAGVRLQTLVEKFLLFAQLEALAADARQRMAAASGARSETADTIIAAAERASQQAGRADDLKMEISPAEHSIRESHLSRLVQELLENAFKFSDEGSPVVIRSRRALDGFVVEVADHGRGMSPENIKKIGAHLQFDRKLQEQQGSGLGLAICRRIADLHGGTMDIQSEPERGTRVSVRLPA